MFEDTLGASLIGVVLAAFAHGISTIQVYRYWVTYRQDSCATRLLVVVAWLLDTFKGVCIYHMQYYYTITSYGNPQAMLNATWSLSLALCMTTVVTFMVQSFFAQRTWNFARKVRPAQIPPFAIQALGLMIATLSLTQLAFGSAATVAALRVKHFSLGDKYRWMGVGWFGSAAVCDILLVLSLSIILATQKTGFERTDMLINRIILYTVNTGLLTGVVATTNLILFCLMPRNLIHFIATFLLGTLYTITLLATLHSGGSSRSSSSGNWQSGSTPRINTQQDCSGDIPLSGRVGIDARDTAITASQRQDLFQVQVNREVCIQGRSSIDGGSRISIDRDDVKCYAVEEKSRPFA